MRNYRLEARLDYRENKGDSADVLYVIPGSILCKLLRIVKREGR